MLPKAHLTSHSRMSGSRWVITPSWLFESWRSFLYSSVYSCHLSLIASAAAAKLLQSCPTLCDPRDSSPPGSTIPGILQARTLKWVAISFSNAWKWKMKAKSLSHVRLFTTPWATAYRLLHPWDSPGKSTGVGCWDINLNPNLIKVTLVILNSILAGNIPYNIFYWHFHIIVSKFIFREKG